MDKLFDPQFRRKWPDRSGGAMRIGWFFLTWSGFTTNPRGRAFGYHVVRDHYLARWGDRLRSFGDEECWHYHHPAASGIGNDWGVDWSANREYEQILSCQILDRGWFPACYRAGGTIMDAVSSRWVDQWFPFDYSNRAPLTIPGLVDWSGGVADWSIYHPSPEHFDRPGAGRRRMARCLDLDTNMHSLTDEEIEAAFVAAEAGRSAVVSCFDHDYRDIADRIDRLCERVTTIAARHPDVRWSYAAPGEAIRNVVNLPAPHPLHLEAMVQENCVSVWSDVPIFQSIPWLAVRTEDGTVQHVERDLIRLDETHWRWCPEQPLQWVEAGFAASTDLGGTATVCVHREDPRPQGFLDTEVGEHALRPRSIWEHSKTYAESCLRRACGDGPEMDSVRQTRELLAGRVEAGMTILDAGCGAGHAWLGLRSLELEYYGIDSYARGIEIGRMILAPQGLPPRRLRHMALEEMPHGERYDVVLCLNTLQYAAMYHAPLEALANAADRWLVVRASFGDRTEIRYLPDILLEEPFQDLHAYFNIFARADVQQFLTTLGFSVEWVRDFRQQTRFSGQPEVVGGIELPYEFLVATRIKPRPTGDVRLGEYFSDAARRWREGREGGPSL